jgi:hypothetical protein
MEEKPLAEHKSQILAANGVSSAEWAVLSSAAYYTPISRRRFIPQAAWESRCGRKPRPGDLEEHEISTALDACLAKDWVMLTKQGHVERERGVLGEYTGDKFVYPDQGVVLTDSGHELHSRVAIEIFGRDYFVPEPRVDPPFTGWFNPDNP